MALLEQTVYINVKDNGIEPRLYLVQADTGRSIRCVIQDWEIPSKATAKVYVRKVSGKVVYNTCEVDTGTNSVLINVTNQMIAEAGADNLAMVEITSGDECVTTFAFFLVVKYKFGSEEESKNEVNWVDELMQEYIDKVSALAEDAQDSAEEADSAAQAAKSSASEAAASASQAETAQGLAEDAASKAEKSAESAASSEANAVSSAESAVKAADEVMEESGKIDERLDRAEGLIDSTIDAANSAAESAAAASNSADSAEDAATRAAASAADASEHSLVDISDKAITFTEASEREELVSGDTVSTLFGKVKKWLSSLAQVAFSGDFSDLSGTDNVQSKTGDTKENTVTFESQDSDDAEEWEDVELLSSGEKHASLFEKISAMFRNVRLLHRMLGDGLSMSGVEDDINFIEKWLGEIEDRVEELEKLHDIDNTRIPFAVYSADDSSMTFYSDLSVPAAGTTYNGKTVTAVYTDFTNFVATSASQLPWNSDKTNFTTIVFDKSFLRVRPISLAYWFYNCSYTTSIDLSGLNSSKVTTMEGTFQSCSSLTALDLTPLDTSNVTTMYYMLGGCVALTDLNISKLNTAKVENMMNMFYNCNKLTELDVSSLDTSSATTLRNMFYYCSRLTKLDVSTFDTRNVENMRGIFNGCSGLTEIKLGSLNTSNVTNMNYMFSRCGELTTVDLSGLDTSNVTDLSDMFEYCYKLATVDISTLDTAKVTDMSYMFRDCNELTTIYSNDSVFVTTKVTSGSNMFLNCDKLVGGNGTAYSSSNITHSMAHVDTASNPGYFTAK